MKMIMLLFKERMKSINRTHLAVELKDFKIIHSA